MKKVVSETEYDYIVRSTIAQHNDLYETDVKYYGGGVSVMRLPSRRNCPAEFGVNWGACGTETPAEARCFSRDLQAAILIAEQLTSKELMPDYSISDDEFVERAKIAAEAGLVSEVCIGVLKDLQII